MSDLTENYRGVFDGRLGFGRRPAKVRRRRPSGVHHSLLRKRVGWMSITLSSQPFSFGDTRLW